MVDEYDIQFAPPFCHFGETTNILGHTFEWQSVELVVGAVDLTGVDEQARDAGIEQQLGTMRVSSAPFVLTATSNPASRVAADERRNLGMQQLVAEAAE